jgi:hypothetical protein
MMPQWVAKAVIEFERNDGLWQVIEVSAQNVCGIMHGVTSPVQTLAVPVRRIKGGPKLLDALL